MPSSGRRRLAAALAIALLSAGAGAGARAGDDLVACRTPGAISVHEKTGWTEIAAPNMSANEGPREVVDHAAAPYLANRLYMTNGVVVKVSEDGGCTWSVLWTGYEWRAPGVDQWEPDTFTNLSTSSDKSLWVASYDEAEGVHHPHVRFFGGLGPTDPQPAPPPINVDNGIPAVGTPIDLQAARGMDTAYLLVEEAPDVASGDVETPTHKLYTTYYSDLPDQANAAEQTLWKELTPPDGFGRIEGFTTTPAPRTAYVWSDTHYAAVVGTDTDEPTWVTHTSPGGQITGVDVNVAGTALVTARTQQSWTTQTADISGKVLSERLDVPLLPTTMTHGTRPGVRVVSSAKGTWGYDVRLRKWVDISPGVTLQDLSTGSGRVERIVLGRTKDAIWRFDTFPGETFVELDQSLFGRGYPQPPHSTITEPYIDVRPGTITVKPGEVKDADIEFGMPPSATPLDVFFLVDTTGSMQGAINGLRKDIKSIADGLHSRLGHSACFGVGDFKDFTALDAANVFRTHLPIAPSCPGMNAELTPVNDALKKLQASAGGDDPEAQTIALTQMVTGKGQTDPLVLPGNGAQFRRESYKVAVLITDAWFKYGSGYPSMDTTVETLKVAGVKVVNVLVLTDLDPNRARADMTKLAEGTDSLAPDGGVDCDGDGKLGYGDLRAGDPLICEANGIEPNIGPVITSLLFGVEDPGTSAVDIQDPDNVVAGPLKGANKRIVNLKRDSRLPFSVPVTCSKEQDGQDLHVGFRPTVRALPVGIANELVVQCRAVPGVAPPPAPEPQPEPDLIGKPKQPQGRAIVPPPNPPVQPVTNMTLNAGFSQQEEQQFQLAAVTQGAGEVEEAGEEIELAMTGLDRPERSVPAGAFIAGAMSIAAAAGLAHRRRLQRSRRVAHARVGRF